MELTQCLWPVNCGPNTTEAAHVTDEALIDLPYQGSEPAYEIWQQRIQNNYC
ncbi:MAG: hypothetical protein DRR19_29460 [Candidatus Parabeggiatoa sp. nov. 1]|nr:MAG: hypothetical protein DRR19_29460 [Gammaproteobacteria bacterium]